MFESLLLAETLEMRCCNDTIKWKTFCKAYLVQFDRLRSLSDIHLITKLAVILSVIMGQCTKRFDDAFYLLL
eukprot:gene9276-10241_t